MLPIPPHFLRFKEQLALDATLITKQEHLGELRFDGCSKHIIRITAEFRDNFVDIPKELNTVCARQKGCGQHSRYNNQKAFTSVPLISCCGTGACEQRSIPRHSVRTLIPQYNFTVRWMQGNSDQIVHQSLESLQHDDDVVGVYRVI
jgi:hypothetical protein